jgi:hypothetical protein
MITIDINGVQGFHFFDIIGDKVDFDSEAESYNAPSKVGQKFTPKEKSKSQDDPKDKGT